MVYVRDDGVFDASIEKIWKYLQDPESHQHESILSQKVLEQKGNTMKIRAEIAGPQGKAEEIWQMRMDPPFGFELQVLEGPSKGSQQTHTYVPMGDKKKVIDVGGYNCGGAGDEEGRKGTLAYEQHVFGGVYPDRMDSYDTPQSLRP